MFDQNISPRILVQIEAEFPESTHVRFESLTDASDMEIFNYARSSAFTIVTFDSDFVDLNILRGIPPRIVWLKTGNLSTINVALILKQNSAVIRDFILNSENGVLEIIKD